jgi:phage terminase small subunit
LKGLNFRQRRFAEYYVIEGNKAKAALKAGYSANSASWQARELYNNPTIRAYIEFLIADQDVEIMASIEEAKRRMTKGFRGELKEEVIVMQTTITTKRDKKGKPVKVTKTVPKIVQKCISIRDSIEATKLYVDLMSHAPTAVDANAPMPTDEALLKALKERKVEIVLPKETEFEEPEVVEDDAS